MIHICCAPCATYCVEALRSEGDLVGVFINPNIQPIEEYLKRLEEASELMKRLQIKLIEAPYDPESWNKAVAGLEDEPEGGRRCEVCFRTRLDEAARIAKLKGCDCLTSTLTLSPHKRSKLIHRIGKEVCKAQGITFRTDDFKKGDGFKKSVELSRQYGLYRQNYCGCTMSRRKK